MAKYKCCVEQMKLIGITNYAMGYLEIVKKNGNLVLHNG